MYICLCVSLFICLCVSRFLTLPGRQRTSQWVYPRGEGGYNTSLDKTPAAHHVDEDDYGKTPEHMGKYSSIAKYKDEAAKAGDVSELEHFLSDVVIHKPGDVW